MIKRYIRGGQLAMHFYRMFAQINKKVLIVAFWFFFGSSLYLIATQTSYYGRYMLFHYYSAKLHNALSGPLAIYQCLDPKERLMQMKVGHFLSHPTTRYYVKGTSEGIQSALIKSGIYTFLGFLLCIYILAFIGQLQKNNQEIRGARFLAPNLLKKLLKKLDKASDIYIANLPLVKNAETQHMLLTGTTGTGKSLYMMEMMDNIRRRQERAIVYDIAGTFVSHFYRKDRDIILDPFDNECAAWNIWQDAIDLADFEAIAASLMPLHLSGSDPYWINSARTVFSTLAEKLRQDQNPKTCKLLEPLFSSDLASLSQLLKGTVAETLVSASVEKMALSIKSTASTYCKSLLYLQTETDPLFSIKRWVQGGASDSWLFIATSAEKMEALKPLISVWLDTAARSILSLAPSHERRLWLLIDELASLHRLPSLSLLLSQGRKYGLCAVSAFQDIHQIRNIYGRDEADALLAMYNTNVFFRTKCPDTALWMSQLTGQRESVERKEGFSYGANDLRDGVSIHQERRKEVLILDTEFQQLNDREAYVILPGNIPISKITLNIKKRAVIASPRTPKIFNSFKVNTETEKKDPKAIEEPVVAIKRKKHFKEKNLNPGKKSDLIPSKVEDLLL